VNLVRHHSVLALGARLRPAIVAQAVADATQAGASAAASPEVRQTPAAPLARAL
jgi:hypothetical protein